MWNMKGIGLKNVNFMFPQSMNHSSHMNILYSIGGDLTQIPFIIGHGYKPQSPKLSSVMQLLRCACGVFGSGI